MSPPPEASANASAGVSPASLALRDFAYAVQALQLYPASSPVGSRAVERAHGRLTPLLAAGRLSLAVLPDTIRIGPEDAGAAGRTVRALAERLHHRGVAHLHLGSSLQARSLQGLAELLATDVEALKERGGISTLCERQQLDGIVLEMLQLEKLFEDDETIEGDPDAAVWEQILGGYRDEVDIEAIDWEGLADDPEQLADFLGWLLDEASPPPGVSEMSRVHIVRAVCERVGGAAVELGADRVDAVAQVFGRFYDKLDKEVWIEVLGQPLTVGGPEDVRSPPRGADLTEEERKVRAVATELGSTDLSAGIGESLNRSQVEDLLVYALTSRKQASPRIFGLFHRLLQQRTERDLMEQAIRDTVERQTKSDSERRTFADLWPQLSEALHGENPDAYMSTTYRAQLDRLLVDAPAAAVWDHERIAPRMREMEPTYLMQRKAKVLLEVVARETVDTDYVTLVTELERALPELIVDGQYISAEEILRSLSDDFIPARGRSVAQREAARDVLMRFCNQHTLREVVRNLAGKQRTQIDAATRIFSSLGPMAVPALLEALSQEQSRPIRVHLVRMLAAIGDQALPEIRKHLRDKRWFFVRNLVWIIGEIGDERFVPHLGIIVNHPDVRVRREAVRSMARLRNEATTKILLGAIDDTDFEVQILAIRGLGTSEARNATPRLRELVKLPNLMGHNTEFIRAAAVALGRIGAQEALGDLRAVARRPLLFRRRRLPAAEAAAWAVATLQGETTGAAPEAVLTADRDGSGYDGSVDDDSASD